MPAISTRETIPNFPLNGYELAIYAVKVFEHECELRDVLSVVREPAVRALKQALENDWVFKMQFTYTGVSFELAFQSHVTRNHEVRCSFTLLPTFTFPTNFAMPKHEPFVRRPIVCTAPPLDGWSPDAEHVVDCFTMAVKVENPNLVRVHCGLPIKITEKVQPKHGDMFGEIKTHELTYNPEDYESLPDPVVTDQSADFVKAWGLEGVADVYYRAVGAHVGKLHEWRETAMAMVRAESPELDAMRKRLIADIPVTAEELAGYPGIPHQRLDEQELVAHVDLPEAVLELLRPSVVSQFDRTLLLEGIKPEWDGTVECFDGVRRSLLDTPQDAQKRAESDSEGGLGDLGTPEPSDASGSAVGSFLENAQKRATTNPGDDPATLHGSESANAPRPVETPGNGIVAREPVSKRDRKRCR
jgi:hypothetical protein